VQYVSNIHTYHLAYQLVMQSRQLREDALEKVAS